MRCPSILGLLFTFPRRESSVTPVRHVPDSLLAMNGAKRDAITERVVREGQSVTAQSGEATGGPYLRYRSLTWQRGPGTRRILTGDLSQGEESDSRC
jgi:hypothetical protein